MKYEIKAHSKCRDLTGLKFNNLTGIKRVKDRISKGGFKAVQWLFLCDCGNKIVLTTNRVTMGKTKSCGCKKNLSNQNRKFEHKEASYRARATALRAQAKHRTKDFQISIEEVVELIRGNCFYCKTPPSMPFNSIKNRSKGELHRSYMSKEHLEAGEILCNGIDRIDSNEGYIFGNVVACCKTCNFAKNDLSIKDFYNWVQKIHKEFGLP